MALRQLTEIERQRLKRLAAESVEVTLIQPTRTGLGKGILDATAPIRNYLKAANIHDYVQQPHGRLAWTLTFKRFGDPRFVDLSVMPRMTLEETSDA